MGQILISAANKSAGKTIVSTGICAALHAQGKTIQPFKKGPDYIDPMWLSAAAQRSCYNLDFWTQSEQEIRQLFGAKSEPCDISIIEANKGLYDGLAMDGSNSNAALAKLLDSSVVLVLDCRGTIRGIAPLLLGYQQFDPAVKIKGVILNFVGGQRHERKLRQIVETYTDLAILGVMYKDSELLLEERYLGLMPSNEDPQAQQRIQALGQRITEQIDLELLLALASPLPDTQFKQTVASIPANQYPVRIAYAKDRAFGFYYADDLNTFSELGATLIPFDTLSDHQLPAADGVFIGGGFPEKHLDALHANTSLRSDIQRKLTAGMPAYAECGGLMYLCNSIHFKDHNRSMVGLIDADCHMNNSPQGRGYTQFNENPDSIWPEPSSATIHAHEFHYSHLQGLAQDTAFNFTITRGCGIQQQRDGLRIANTLACYAHQRHTEQNPWINRFLQFVAQASIA